MTYNRNDTIKINPELQHGFMSEVYTLNCPYVRLVRHHQTNSQTAMVYVSLLNIGTGRIHRSFAMNLDLTGSVLREAANARD